MEFPGTKKKRKTKSELEADGGPGVATGWLDMRREAKMMAPNRASWRGTEDCLLPYTPWRNKTTVESNFFRHENEESQDLGV